MSSMATEQIALDLSPLVQVEHEPHHTIAERFEAFHAVNPHVAAGLEQLAAEWLGAGHRKVGVKALVERLRWEAGIRTSGDDYRINNDFTAHYARLLIERRPEWADAIETRALRAD